MEPAQDQVHVTTRDLSSSAHKRVHTWMGTSGNHHPTLGRLQGERLLADSTYHFTGSVHARADFSSSAHLSQFGQIPNLSLEGLRERLGHVDYGVAGGGQDAAQPVGMIPVDVRQHDQVDGSRINARLLMLERSNEPSPPVSNSILRSP